MSNINYTRELSIRTSTAVDDAFYNDNDQTLYLDLHDNMYAYSNVPADVVKQFEKADSAGKFYVENIKRNYGPAEDLGHWTDVDYNKVDFEIPAAMPKDLTYAANAVLDGEPLGGEHSLTVSGKDETKATEYFSLSVPSAPVFDGLDYVDDLDYADDFEGVPTTQYKVEFILDGLVRKTVIHASSFGHAVTEVVDAANVFGLEANVRSVSLV